MILELLLCVALFAGVANLFISVIYLMGMNRGATKWFTYSSVRFSGATRNKVLFLNGKTNTRLEECCKRSFTEAKLDMERGRLELKDEDSWWEFDVNFTLRDSSVDTDESMLLVDESESEDDDDDSDYVPIDESESESESESECEKIPGR